MTWSRDGSGLDVKRVRGMTLPQWMTSADRWPKRQNGRTRIMRAWAGSGRWGMVTRARASDRNPMPPTKRRRDRRVKRLAKAAARRAWFVIQRVLNKAAFLCLPDRFKFDMRTCGSIGVSSASKVTGSTHDTPMFDQARKDANAAIARAIIGEADHALDS